LNEKNRLFKNWNLLIMSDKLSGIERVTLL
jgi:hypothetical protein